MLTEGIILFIIVNLNNLLLRVQVVTLVIRRDFYSRHIAISIQINYLARSLLAFMILSVVSATSLKLTPMLVGSELPFILERLLCKVFYLLIFACIDFLYFN